jgi:hypothetical protein
VANVKDYPLFVPWCSGARIRRGDEREIIGGRRDCGSSPHERSVVVKGQCMSRLRHDAHLLSNAAWPRFLARDRGGSVGLRPRTRVLVSVSGKKKRAADNRYGRYLRLFDPVFYQKVNHSDINQSNRQHRRKCFPAKWAGRLLTERRPPRIDGALPKWSRLRRRLKQPLAPIGPQG